MEKQRNEGESNSCHKCAGKYIGHAFSDGSGGLIREIAEKRQKDQSRKIITCHYDTDQPLHIENLFRIACLQLRGRDAVHPPRKDVREESGAPGIIYLPEKKDTKKGETNQEGSLIIKLQIHSFLFLPFSG